jgi:hypothetical protein
VTDLETLSPEFRKDLLALLLHDQLAAKAIAPELPEDFYEYSPEYHTIFTGFREFIDLYGARPRQHELIDYLTDMCKTAKLDPTSQRLLFDALDNVWDHTQYTPSRVKKKITGALRAHAIIKVVTQVPDFIEDSDYEGLRTAFTTASSLGKEEVPIVEYWDDLDERVKRRKNTSVSRIATGFDPLDALITNGVPRGALSMIIGGSGKGKSVFMGQVASQASLLGYTVALVTLELGLEDVMTRMDSFHSHISVSDVPIAATKVNKRVRSVFAQAMKKQQTPGALYVKYYPTKSVGLDQIEEFVERLQEDKGVTLDLLVVDYFDLLRMTGSYKNRWEALEENCEMLRGLAGKYQMAIWTGGQVTRGGISKELVDMDDISAAFGKVFPLDLLVTMSQTKDEQIKNAIRFHLAKSRLGPSGGVLFAQPDFDKMRFEMLTEDEAKKRGLFPKKKKKKSQGGNLTNAMGSQGP